MVFRQFFENKERGTLSPISIRTLTLDQNNGELLMRSNLYCYEIVTKLAKYLLRRRTIFKFFAAVYSAYDKSLVTSIFSLNSILLKYKTVQRKVFSHVFFFFKLGAKIHQTGLICFSGEHISHIFFNECKSFLWYPYFKFTSVVNNKKSSPTLAITVSCLDRINFFVVNFATSMNSISFL